MREEDQPRETNSERGGIIGGMTFAADGANNDNDAAASSWQNPDLPSSPSLKAKRKRRLSAGVKIGQAAKLPSIATDWGMVADGPQQQPSFQSFLLAEGNTVDDSSEKSGETPLDSDTANGKHSGIDSAATKVANSHHDHAPNFPPSLLDQQSLPCSSFGGQFNRSDSAALRRPTKQSRGGLFPDSGADAALQNKQGLLNKLIAYGSTDEGDFDDDDEGDVSGEDVFSDDDCASVNHGHLKMSAAANVASSTLPSFPATSFGLGHSLSQWEESHRRIKWPIETGRVINGEGGQKRTAVQPRILVNRETEKEMVTGSRTQPFLGYLRPPTMEAYRSSRATAGNLGIDMGLSTQLGRATDFDSSHAAVQTSGSKFSGQSAHVSSQEAFTHLHSKMMSQQQSENHRGGVSTTSEPTHQMACGDRTSDFYTTSNSFHTNTSRRGALTNSNTSRDEKTRGIFADLEAQIMQQEALDNSQHSCSLTSASPDHLTRGDANISQGSIASRGSGLTAVVASSGDGALYDRVREMPDFPKSNTHQTPRSEPEAALYNEAAALSWSSRSNIQPHEPLGIRGHSRNVIANMEAVLSQRAQEDAISSGRGRSSDHNGLARFNARRRGILRDSSREVIASIEADLLRREEEENIMEASNPVAAMQNRQLDPYARGSRQPAGMNQRDVLSIMMMQQHHQNRQEGSHVSGNGALADQISNMAIDPLHLEADDDSSAKSINSFVSYDGKCTHVYASRAQTHDQELACHALNDAICDLYGAPVARILRHYSMVTRLIRADDDTGNVQLHYAVRNGNVKAIRRIIRADPGCALIRNNQGYCPLHFAVQIGNFAAVQLLCCMVPASAEVQCEEGCLPLHEAVSSAAQLVDAPQITAVLINAFPSAIKITNDEGLLPLHLAAMSGFSAGIRTIFAYGFSTIYARENTEEMLPLDFAIEGYKTLFEERTLVPSEESNDGAMMEKEMEFRQCIDFFLISALYDRPTQRGMTFLPIHGAAAAQPCSQSWKHIVSMYGSHASDVDVRGRTALHVLVTSALTHLDVVIEMIVDINELDPTSVTTFDDSGLIPLHAALSHLAPYPVIEYLLICNWGTISMEVDEDCDNLELRGMLPFQLAAACDCSLDVVNLLLRAHPIGVAGALPNEC